MLTDMQLFEALIFAKKSIEGGLSPTDFLFLEQMRNGLMIEDPLVFHKLLEKSKQIYFDKYCYRRRN